MNTLNCECNLFPNAPQNSVLRKTNGGMCGVQAVIPSFTVPTKANLKGIKDAFVHVQDINTTYYINNLHQPITTWAGIIWQDNYNYEENPLGVRDNLVYDKEAELLIAYDRLGGYKVYDMSPKIIVDSDLSTTSTNPVQNRTITVALQDEVDARERDDEAIRQDVHDEMERIDTVLSGEIEEINGTLDDAYLTDIAVDSTASTDTINLVDASKNILTKATASKEIPLPVASGTQAGVMNAATFNALQETAGKVDIIENASIALEGLAEDITQEGLTEAWKSAEHQAELINGARIFDVDNQRIWTYYENIQEWKDISTVGGASVSVSRWTNDTAGIIKGSETNGQLFAESDGTGSVNGWDTLVSNVNNNTTSITGKLDKLTGTASYNRAYIVNKQGEQINAYVSYDVVADAIVQRATDGHIYVPLAPTTDREAASKKYVDDAVGDIEAALATINSGNGVQTTSVEEE